MQKMKGDRERVQVILKSPEVQRYTHSSEYIQSMWLHHKEWVFCYQNRMLIRGNHTNNYAETGMLIWKKTGFQSYGSL